MESKLGLNFDLVNQARASAAYVADDTQRFIDQRPNRAQRMIRRNEIVQLRHREKTFLNAIRSAHLAHLFSNIMNTIYRTSTPQTPLTRGQISTAC